MAVKLYGPANGVAKEIGHLYGSVNGVAKEIKKLYGSVNGVAKLIYGGGEDNPYLTLYSANSNTMTLNGGSIGDTVNLEYSLDGLTWTAWDYKSGGITWTGDLYLRGYDNDTFAHATSVYYYFAFTSAVAIKGNIMRLLEYDEELTAIPRSYCFCGLFYNCATLTSAPSLPAATLAEACYRQMFYGCTGLTTIPALPATTLMRNCYGQMFSECSNIKMSTTQDSTYANTYTFGAIPSSTYAGNMFYNTGGSFTGTPTVQTLYTSNTIIR